MRLHNLLKRIAMQFKAMKFSEIRLEGLLKRLLPLLTHSLLLCLTMFIFRITFELRH